MCARPPENVEADTRLLDAQWICYSKNRKRRKSLLCKGIAQTGVYGPYNCNDDDYQLFTNANYHEDEIQEYIKKFQEYSEDQVPPSKSCTISDVPLDRFVSMRGNSTAELDVGNEIDYLGSIVYSCELGYYLIGSSSDTCTSGAWNRKVPSCEPSVSQSEANSVHFENFVLP